MLKSKIQFVSCQSSFQVQFVYFNKFPEYFKLQRQKIFKSCLKQFHFALTFGKLNLFWNINFRSHSILTLYFIYFVSFLLQTFMISWVWKKRINNNKHHSSIFTHISFSFVLLFPVFDSKVALEKLFFLIICRLQIYAINLLNTNHFMFSLLFFKLSKTKKRKVLLVFLPFWFGLNALKKTCFY